MDPQGWPKNGLRTLMDRKQTKAQKINVVMQTWLQESMTNDQHHMNMIHDLERARRVYGCDGQDVGQWPSPNGLGFQSN